jgi:hypothetical protein
VRRQGFLVFNLSRYQKSEDCFLAESLARFQPMKPLEQDKPVPVAANANRGLLPDFQHALGDLVDNR